MYTLPTGCVCAHASLSRCSPRLLYRVTPNIRPTDTLRLAACFFSFNSRRNVITHAPHTPELNNGKFSSVCQIFRGKPTDGFTYVVSRNLKSLCDFLPIIDRGFLSAWKDFVEKFLYIYIKR